MTTKTKGPWLLYAILEPGRMDRLTLSEACDMAGVEDAPLSCIDAGILQVVASRVAQPKRIPSASVQQILAFKSVVDAVFQAGPVIPLRFGTLVPSVPDAAALVEEKETRYLDALERVAGHVEMGVAIEPRDEGHDTAAQRDDHLHPSKAESRGHVENTPGQNLVDQGEPTRTEGSAHAEGPGTSYLRARAEARTRSRERLDAAVRPFTEALSPFSAAVSPASTSGDSISLAFLVPRASVDAFRQAADDVRCAEAGAVDIVGPWAPYSFV